MGIPTHYSQDLPDRCLQLIDKLWPAVQGVKADGQADMGPLTTTFLLALASPIIVLPIERIERWRGGHGSKGYVNDRPMDEKLAHEVDRVLNAARFDSCPFFEKEQWRFATLPFDHQNFALEFPPELKENLDNATALASAAALHSAQWASCLRNAISHGGVSYLDAHGWASHGGETKMLAFVSATYPKYPKEHVLAGRRDTTKAPEELKVLRISESGFRSFLGQWVKWLKESGISRELAKAA